MIAGSRTKELPMLIRLLLLAGLAAFSGSAALAQSVPVMVGGKPNQVACSGTGQVAPLKADGDRFLSVRTGPGTKFKEIERLLQGNALIICETRGDWLGVVFDWGSGEWTVCGTFSPIASRQAYRGPCRSGWVFGRYIVPVAD
jgi:hypothetical protein